jgi:hypothetical protein
VSDGVAGEARQRGDTIGDLGLANGSEREEIIEGERAKRADHAQRGQPDAMRSDFRQSSQDYRGIDTLQGMDQRRDRKHNNEETRSDPEPFPADLLLEATPKRGQQPMHSSSRQGGNKNLSQATGDGRNAPCAKTHKPKSRPCAVLDNPSFCLRSPPLSYTLHMSSR